jgi:hypothetical protein
MRLMPPRVLSDSKKTSQLSTPIPNPTGYGDHRFISKMETPIHPEVQYFDIDGSAVDRSRYSYITVSFPLPLL